MTLATIPLSRSPPVAPHSSARARIADAAAELRRGIADLEREDRERAAQRERAWQETKAKAERRVQLAAARQATASMRIEVDRKWFWSFNNETLDLLRAIAADAQKRGEMSDARMIEAHINSMCDQLEAIQKKEAGKP
jgi:hypothetical protein